MLLNYYKTKPLMRCRYLSLLVPLSSMAALLILSIFSLIPDIFIDNNLVYAVEEDNDSNNDSISLQADTPSASLIIGNSSTGSNTEFSNTGTSDNDIEIGVNVSIEGTLLNSYNLQISGNPTLEGNSTINSIPSDKASLDNNEWGYKWDNTGNYKGISTTPTTIVSNTGLNTATGTVSYTKPLTFSAKFSDQAEAGHYKTSVNLLLTATPKELITYTLNYNGNGTNVSNVPASQSANSYNNYYEFIIPNTIPVRDGYTFLGWSDLVDATSPTYRADSPFLSIGSVPTRTIYAVWLLNDPWASITTMQQMTAAACSAVSVGKSTTLTDSRDNSTYTIRKHEDGKCWMTQNLRLVGSRILTSANSDVSSNFSLPASDGTGVALTEPMVYYGSSTNEVYGGYYNWAAATAGTYRSGTAPSSICPKGWRLPTSDEFDKMLSAAGNNLRNSETYNFGVYAGWIQDSSLYGRDTNGMWWTNYGSNAYRPFYLTMNSSSAYVNSSSDNYSLYSIRCIAQY